MTGLVVATLLDREGKWLADSSSRGIGVAGAALIELTSDGVLTLDPAGNLAPAGEPVANPILAEVPAWVVGRKPKKAIEHLTGVRLPRTRAEGLIIATLADLAADRVLVEQKGRAFGVAPVTRWVPGPGHEMLDQIRESMRRVLLQGETPDARVAGVVAVLSGLGVTHKLFPGENKRAITQRAKQVAESNWAGEAVQKAVKDVQAAAAGAAAAAAAAAAVGGGS